MSKKSLTIVGVTASNKDYDQTTSATIDATGGSYSGLVYGETFALAGTPVGTFADKNVGTNKTVTITGFTAPSANYELSADPTTTASITPKAIVGSFTADNKVYDATTDATVLTRTVTPIAGDDLTLDGGTATFDTKNVGTGKTVTLAAATLGGADAGNYTLTSVNTTTANVTAISLVGAFTVTSTKVYDGNTTANVLTRTIPSGVLAGETVTLVGGTAAYNNKNVGTGKAVTLTNASLGGDDAGNYILSSVTDTTADITKKDVSGTFTVSDKVYDGTTTSTIATRSVVGTVSGDDLSLNGGAGTFSNKNVGTAKTVTPNALANWSLGGTDAGNYNLTSIANSTGNITKKPLLVTVEIADKVYDTTTSATIVSTTSNASPLDDLTVTSTAATFVTKAAGDSKAVTVTGVSMSGTDAGNYELASSTVNATGKITKAPLTLSFLVAASKVYDGTTTATVTGASLSGIIGDDIVDSVNTVDVVANYNNKNVGTSKPVTVASYTPTGVDGGNYQVTSFSPRTANITAKEVTVTSWTASNKVYDGTTSATIASSNLSGVITGDTVSLGGTATFANKNVGTAKVVSIASPVLTGADASNYSLSGSAGTATADITARTITPVYSAADKLYDGTTDATVSLDSDDRVSGDVLTFTYNVPATFADKYIGANKDVTISNIAISGTDAGNYEVNSTSQVVQASILNNPPLVTTSSGASTYVLVNSPVVVDPEIAVVDDDEFSPSDTPNFDGGSLTVSISNEADPNDVLSIMSQGAAPGEISVSGNDVFYSGVLIGTVSGGSGGVDLVVSLNANANAANTQALARRIGFSNSSSTANLNQRTVAFVVSDGDGGVSAPPSEKLVDVVTTTSAKPVLTPSAGATSYTENAAPTVIDSGITLSDPDTTAFTGGVLTVSFSGGGTADDRLAIASVSTAGGISINGSNVRFNTTGTDRVVIGTFSGGVGTDPLVINLNSEADISRTEALLRAITFENVSNAPSTLPRSVSFVLSDGEGGVSDPAIKTVNVTAVTDPPVLTASSYIPIFTESLGVTTEANTVPVIIDTGITVVSPDMPSTFNGGVLTVFTQSNSQTVDRYGIASTGGVSGSATGAQGTSVSYSGTVIGTITTSTATQIVITFNSSATIEGIQAVARAVTFRNIGDLPGQSRRVRFTFKESAAGLTSTFVEKTVQIVQTNDGPRFTGFVTPASATSGGAAVNFNVTSVFLDPFNGNVTGTMANSTLSVAVTSGSTAGISLSVAAGGNLITSSGSTILHNGTAFATITSNTAGNLLITFNASANTTRITALIKQLRLQAASGTTLGARTLTTTLTEASDGDTVTAVGTTTIN
ncbi:MAG: beta strand repeat-containing protein [Pirellulaceae bacterium]